MDNTRVKVSFNAPTLTALKLIATEQGQSLSSLIAGAAIQTYIGTNYRAPKQPQPPAELSQLLERLSKIEALLTPDPKKPRKKRWGPRLGVAGCSDKPMPDNAAPVKVSPDQSITTGQPVHIDHLIERFGNGAGLKARLCQVGGRGGELFEGSITHAKAVAKLTSALDPKAQSWLPRDSDRVWWLATDPVSYCMERLQSQR